MPNSAKQSDLDTPVILEAAINGMTTKDKNPKAPTSHAEIERDALLCYELGATIVHAHNSDIGLTGEAADGPARGRSTSIHSDVPNVTRSTRDNVVPPSCDISTSKRSSAAMTFSD